MNCQSNGCPRGAATAYVVVTVDGVLGFAKAMCEHHALAWETIVTAHPTKKTLRIYRKMEDAPCAKF